ncbi:MAG: PEP-CTERM sorting domain-containing protein [Chthonomonadaceae bacterium]|nr:PEP-CTERM sorting domain-containing protein [Chthonomonadaceae bacterium]
MNSRVSLGLLTASFLTVTSIAQTRNSFLAADSISGISVTTSNAGLTFLVQTSADPTFVYQSVTYHVTKIMGFYNLSDDDDLAVSNSDFTGNFGPWTTNNTNASTGGVAGWKTNPNSSLTVGGSESFTYSSLSLDNVERLGFHVQVDGLFPGTNGNTGNITTVPEPGSIIAFAVGLATFYGRRRKQSVAR